LGSAGFVIEASAEVAAALFLYTAAPILPIA